MLPNTVVLGRNDNCWHIKLMALHYKVASHVNHFCQLFVTLLAVVQVSFI